MLAIRVFSASPRLRGESDLSCARACPLNRLFQQIRQHILQVLKRGAKIWARPDIRAAAVLLLERLLAAGKAAVFLNGSVGHVCAGSDLERLPITHDVK